MTRSSPDIRTARVRLRLLAEEDLEMTLAWRNREEVRQWFGRADIISLDAHRAWFREHQLVDDALMFIVEEIETSVPVGQVSVYGIDRESGVAEVGRFIAAPGVSGKGLIREAIHAMVDFAFSELVLERVCLEVMPSNARAIRLYESLGFVAVKNSDDAKAKLQPTPQAHPTGPKPDMLYMEKRRP